MVKCGEETYQKWEVELDKYYNCLYMNYINVCECRSKIILTMNIYKRSSKILLEIGKVKELKECFYSIRFICRKGCE